MSSAVAARGEAPFSVDFTAFVDDVARELAASVPPWRVRIGEAAAQWRDAGMHVGVLERALRLESPPDVDALLSTYAAAVTRCRALSAAVVEVDPSLARHAAFCDPSRLAEAEALAARAAAPRAVPSPDRASIVDPESWVVEWPNVADFLVDDLADWS